MPNTEQAVVEIIKLREYCLSPEHPRGRHKARVFRATLGITSDDDGLLQAALLEAARSGDAKPVNQDDYGQRFVVDFEMSGIEGSGTKTIRSQWIVRTDEDFPRFVTCYVL